MTPRILLVLSAALFLAACTEQDWNRATSFVDFSDRPKPKPVARVTPAPRPVAAPAPIAPQAAPPNAFCQSVATEDSDSNGFDPATQNRVFVRSYQQCVAVFGDVTPQ